MKKILVTLAMLAVQVSSMQSAYAFLQSVPGYVGDGALFVETDSIVKNGPIVNLIYVENFNQPQAYSSQSYLSKATDVRIDCTDKRIYARAEAFFSDINLQGDFLGKYYLRDEFGQTPAAGSWNFNLIKIGCGFAL